MNEKKYQLVYKMFIIPAFCIVIWRDNNGEGDWSIIMPDDNKSKDRKRQRMSVDCF